MSDSTMSRRKSLASIREGYSRFADRGMALSLVMAVANGGHSMLSGSMPHWAAYAGAAISAAYLALPDVRAFALGRSDTPLPAAVGRAAEQCAVRATQEGGRGIWAVHERASDTTRFLTEAEFVDFRIGLAPGVDIAIIDAEVSEIHVRRYVDGVLDSGDGAAHQVYDWSGDLVRSVDYRQGLYAGDREPSGMRLS